MQCQMRILTPLIFRLLPTDEFFIKAKLRMPSSLATVAIHIDAETLAWFQSKGKEAEQHMAAALRIYAEAQKNAASMRQSA